MLQLIRLMEAEKEEFKKSKYIQTGKAPHENFNSDILPEAIRDEYVQLLMPLILNLDAANELLKESYEIWNRIKNNDKDTEISLFSSYYFNKLRINTVLIVHIMKHFMDMMIIFLIEKVFGVEENSIKRIGKWRDFKDKPDELIVLDKYQEFFDELNTIENANKHHLTSVYSAQLFRDDELCFFAINERENNIIRSVEAKKMVKNINAFFQDALELCRHYQQKNDAKQVVHLLDSE